MMTFDEVSAKITNAAKTHGFNIEQGQKDRLPRIMANEENGYVNICLLDVIDFPKCDYAKGHIAGHIEIRASVSRMGGNPTPEELLNASEQIKEAALLVLELQGSDLAYSETRRGF